MIPHGQPGNERLRLHRCLEGDPQALADLRRRCILLCRIYARVGRGESETRELWPICG